MRLWQENIKATNSPLKYRLFWFCAIWAMSVGALGVVATLIKFALRLKE